MTGSDLWDKSIQAASIVLGGIILAWLNKLGPKIDLILKRKKSHLSFEQEVELSARATGLLNRALGELQADRVFYSKIHNGDSLETRRKSRVYEVVGPGMTNDFDLYQNVPIGLVLEEMELVEVEGPSWITIDELPDGRFKRLLQISGVQGVARCAVRRLNKIIGFLGVDFVRHQIKPPNIDKLCHYAALLEQILELYE